MSPVRSRSPAPSKCLSSDVPARSCGCLRPADYFAGCVRPQTRCAFWFQSRGAVAIFRPSNLLPRHIRCSPSIADRWGRPQNSLSGRKCGHAQGTQIGRESSSAFGSLAGRFRPSVLHKEPSPRRARRKLCNRHFQTTTTQSRRLPSSPRVRLQCSFESAGQTERNIPLHRTNP